VQYLADRDVGEVNWFINVHIYTRVAQEMCRKFVCVLLCVCVCEREREFVALNLGM